MRHCTRRRALRGGGIAVFGSIAGCSALPIESSDSEDLTFERINTMAVYVASEVDVSMPSEIETVKNPSNADLLVLPSETDVDAKQAVEWFTDDRVLALLGDGSEATWLSWARSDAFEDTFANEGFSDAEPDPSLVIGAKIGQYVKTYRHSWADDPRNRDILRTLDESLVDIENETPPN